MEEQQIEGQEVEQTEQVETADPVDPEPVEQQLNNVSLYETPDYTIELVHQITLGDILTSTLLSVLIIVILLSRLIGGRGY